MLSTQRKTKDNKTFFACKKRLQSCREDAASVSTSNSRSRKNVQNNMRSKKKYRVQGQSENRLQLWESDNTREEVIFEPGIERCVIFYCVEMKVYSCSNLLSSYHICTGYHAWQTLVSIHWRLSIMEGRKYFVEHLLCFKCSASCFTYAYSLTIKTSCKVSDFLYKWENWSSLRSHTQKWEQLRISAWSL